MSVTAMVTSMILMMISTMAPMPSLGELNPIHWILAYLGLAIHQLLKMAAQKGPITNSFKRHDILVLLASSISIPAILILCTDTSLAELLPINYVTAFLAGYQTQSFLRTVSALGVKTPNASE